MDTGTYIVAEELKQDEQGAEIGVPGMMCQRVGIWVKPWVPTMVARAIMEL